MSGAGTGRRDIAAGIDVPPEALIGTAPEARRDIAPEARRDTAPEARRDIAPEARRDIAPEARRDTAPEALIDRARYPVTDLEAPAAKRMIATEQQRLADTGVSILPGFLAPEAVRGLCREADELAPQAHFSEVSGTPYLERPDRAFAEGHPRRTVVRSALRAVAYDQFPAASTLRTLYEWDPMMTFLGRVLGRSPLYRYADPMGALNLAVMVERDELGWHFDQTDFVVSIALQNSEGGGDFVSARHIRDASGENYDAVAEVLRGEAHESVERVPMNPGTLMLFEGRNSMHRVTPITGPTPRYVALLAYDTRPDTVSSDQLKLARYGRVS